MSTDITELVQRLTRAEHEIALLRSSTSKSRYAKWIVDALALIGVVVAAVLVRSPDPQAQALTSSVVKAPFVVVDSNNQPIMKVQESGPRGVVVLNAQGQVVVNASVRPNGHGSVFARNGTKGIDGPGAGVYFDDDGNGALGMSGADGKLIVQIRKEAVSLYDPTSLYVFNTNKYSAVTLEVGKSGSGHLTIGDPAGDVVVEAGVASGSGVGQVRAGPAAGPTGPGIPPSFIKGWKK